MKILISYNNLILIKLDKDNYLLAYSFKSFIFKFIQIIIIIIIIRKVVKIILNNNI